MRRSKESAGRARLPNRNCHPQGGKSTEERPSLALAITTIMIVDTGIALPYSPFTRLFGFVPLPAPFFVFLAISTVTF